MMELWLAMLGAQRKIVNSLCKHQHCIVSQEYNLFNGLLRHLLVEIRNINLQKY